MQKLSPTMQKCVRRKLAKGHTPKKAIGECKQELKK